MDALRLAKPTRFRFALSAEAARLGRPWRNAEAV